MGFDRQNILEQIEKNIPTECPDCFERLYFKGAGKYTCPRCHKIYYDYFGLIKKYLEENGPAPAVEIANNTGISLEIIDALLEDGRLEMPKEFKDVKVNRFSPETKIRQLETPTFCNKDAGKE